jgi:hypothetical protein
MHPYEDWAETFAHYLHILDTLQTANSFKLGPRRRATNAVSFGPTSDESGADPTRPTGDDTFGEVIDHWLELSYALNQVNQSMGREDLYPFVLAPMVIRKLAFVDRLIRRRSPLVP